MDPDPVVLPETATVGEVAKLLGEKDVRAVLIKTKAGALSGIYTERDLSFGFARNHSLSIAVTEVMTRFPVFVDPETSLEECAEKMMAVGCHHMPVLLDSKIVGMVEILKVQQEIDNQLKQHLASLQSMQEKIARRDEYLGIVAHDVRSPLGVIMVCCEMLQLLEQNKNLGFQTSELYDRIKFNTKYALQLVGDLLDIGRLNSGQKLNISEVDASEFITEHLKNLEFSAWEKQVTLVAEPAPAIRVHIDKHRFGEIVVNLVQNAIKFTRKGTQVIVKSEFVGTAGKTGLWRLSIKDEGPGIPKDKMEMIFGKYQQADNESRKLGFGLGLSIAQQFTRLHDGKLEVTSEEGKGSTFSVTVPDAELSG